MKNRSLAAFILGSALAFAAQAQDAKKAEPGPGQTPDPQIFESILTCLATGLTPDWQKAWFVIREIDRNEAEGTRQFEGDFFYATSLKDRKGKRLQTCGPEQVIQSVSDLNDYLTKEQQRWTSATFTFTKAGSKYDVKYDYTPFKPKPPAAAPAAKKKQEPAK